MNNATYICVISAYIHITKKQRGKHFVFVCKHELCGQHPVRMMNIQLKKSSYCFTLRLSLCLSVVKPVAVREHRDETVKVNLFIGNHQCFKQHLINNLVVAYSTIKWSKKI